MTVALLIASMVALIALGVPLVFSLLASSVLTILVVRPDVPLVLIPQLFVGGIDSFALLAIALFFLAGELMSEAGIVDRILAFARAFVGHLRGGLAHIGVISSVVMAGISGSAVADAAALGPVLIGAMKREGYPPAFAAAIVKTASTVGPIIPPSIPMIVYAVTADVSVGALFMAGVVPGLVMAAALSATVAIVAARRKLPRSDRAGWGDALRATAGASLALLAPILIVGGIRGGIFTATEAGAIATLYVLGIGVLVYRSLGWHAIGRALVRAARGTSAVLVLLGASSIFAWIVADQRLGHQLAAAIQGLELSPWLLLAAINVLLLVIGMFLEPLPAIVILVPVLLPLVQAIGMDLVQFGVMVVLNLVIGLCTPPIGALIYICAAVAETSPLAVVRAAAPFLIALLIVLALVTYVPALSLWLPALLAFG